MRFSERKGIKPVKALIQTDSMDADLRNGLWNALTRRYWNKAQLIGDWYDGDRDAVHLLQSVWSDYFKEPIDRIPNLWSNALLKPRAYFLNCQWYEAYDFIEFVNSVRPDRAFQQECNNILERELSAYRFVGEKLVQITSEEEIAAIEEAIGTTDPMRPVAVHLRTALDLLADRKSPDYRNSIKESISAVESASKLMTGDDKGGLAEALKNLKSKVGLHPALEKAFTSMYGYTSDADGIRHALMDEPTLSFEDAKFMLVSCSAFVSYLTAKAAK
jgi:hypothetical protein